MKPSLCDVPVFMIFFNRPDTFQKVFDAVREARPSRLFLACDGPREGRSGDIALIAQCQTIAEGIDWDCEVHRDYSEVNLGCGYRMKSGLDWVFSHVDRVIVLEDDCVPSFDFFPFCAELLERYKDDQRICMIDAMNKLGVYEDCPYDYFFGQGCCWGWATWRRVWEKMDYKVGFLDSPYDIRCVESSYPYYSGIYECGLEKRRALEQGRRLSAWTYQFGISCALQGQIAIVPKRNLITNIGLTADSGHAVNNIKKLDRATQGLFNTPTYPVTFPLKHPGYIIEDRNYYELCEKRFAATPLRILEGKARHFLYSSPTERVALLKKALGRTCRKVFP